MARAIYIYLVAFMPNRYKYWLGSVSKILILNEALFMNIHFLADWIAKMSFRAAKYAPSAYSYLKQIKRTK